MILLWKNNYCFSAKNNEFSQNWEFDPFLALWLSDIFLTYSENKKWFFSQMDHFLFTKQANLVVRKISYSTTPRCFWNILLLRCLTWKIFKHGFFVPLYGPISCCDSRLLGKRLFIQIHSETLCCVTMYKRHLKWLCLTIYAQQCNSYKHTINNPNVSASLLTLILEEVYFWVLEDLSKDFLEDRAIMLMEMVLCCMVAWI